MPTEIITLTNREFEILRFVHEIYSAKRIGLLMNISHRTVEGHIEAIKMKLNCKSKHELLAINLNNMES